MIRIGVTGTDTGVGKTVVSAALLGLLRRRGLRVTAMKPVETGVRNDAPADAELLRRAAGRNDPLDDVVPYRFPDPLAPLVAAERAGMPPIEARALDAAFARLARNAAAIVVEGAGGLLVPLTPCLSYADLFARWQLELIVVAANRLGAINHILLTVQAARNAGIPIRGIVLNPLQTETDLAMETNPRAIRGLLADVPLVLFPWLERVTDLDVLADTAARSGLDTLILDQEKP